MGLIGFPDGSLYVDDQHIEAVRMEKNVMIGLSLSFYVMMTGAVSRMCYTRAKMNRK